MAMSDYILLSQSKLFDPEFYLSQNPDVARADLDPVQHYLREGAAEGRRPHPFFDGNWYLRQNPDVREDRWNPLVHYLRYGVLEGRPSIKPIAIYTAVVGDSNPPPPPALQDSDLDWFLFSDRLTSAPPPWLVMPISFRYGTSYLTSRYYKARPHMLLPRYLISVWVDPDSSSVGRLNALPERFRGQDTGFFIDEERHCAYRLLKDWIHRSQHTKKSFDKFEELLRHDGYPRSAGLVTDSVLVRKHRDRNLIFAMEHWWKLLSEFEDCDQLALNFVLWKYRIYYDRYRPKPSAAIAV